MSILGRNCRKFRHVGALRSRLHSGLRRIATIWRPPPLGARAPHAIARKSTACAADRPSARAKNSTRAAVLRSPAVRSATSRRVVVGLGRRVAALARLRLARLRFARDALAARDQQVALEPRLRRAFGIDEAELLDARIVAGDDDAHDAAVLQPAEQHLVGERRLDLRLDDARHRPRAHRLVIAVVDQPGARLVGKLDRDVAVGELRLELQDELVDDARDDFLRQPRERHDRVEPVAEFRREQPVDRLGVVAFALGAVEAERRLAPCPARPRWSS